MKILNKSHHDINSDINSDRDYEHRIRRLDDADAVYRQIIKQFRRVVKNDKYEQDHEDDDNHNY